MSKKRTPANKIGAKKSGAKKTAKSRSTSTGTAGSPKRQKSSQGASGRSGATSGRKTARSRSGGRPGGQKTPPRAKSGGKKTGKPASSRSKTAKTAPQTAPPQADGTTRATIRLPDELEWWSVDDLIPYERNPRTHSENQITKIAASLIEFGWTNPILADDYGNVIAGHGRLLAAQMLGMETVPVIRLPHMTDEQRRAYVIADNQLALDAGWDEELLVAELGALRVGGFNMAAVGFDLHELHKLIGGVPTEEIETPEPPDDPVTVLGDLWVLGDHRLICGDCSDQPTMDRLMDGARIDLINTDPPYNVKVEPRSNNALIDTKARTGKLGNHQGFDRARRKNRGTKATGKMRAKDMPLMWDFASAEDFAAMITASIGVMAGALRPGRHFYFWAGYSNLWGHNDAPCVPPMIVDAGLFVCQMLVWHKLHPVLVSKPFLHDYEVCLFGWKTGAAHQRLNVVDVTDVWPVKKINPATMVHLTEKPVELAARAVQYSSAPGDRVLDSFAGSGSTLMACEQHDRVCYTSELAPAYCDVIVRRWQDETGMTAHLESTGRAFDDVATERGATS